MAWVEYRVVMISIIFMFILNISLVALIGSGNVEEYDRDEVINEITGEMDAVTNFITSALINIGVAMFSIFGVDFIVLAAEVPLFIANGLLLYNLITVSTLVFYLVRILWIGG